MRKTGLALGIVAAALALAAAPASARKGDLIVAEYDGAQISRVNPNNGEVSIVSSDPTLAGASYMGLAPDGSLFVSDNSENQVFRVPSGGGDPSEVASDISASDQAWGLDRAADGQLLVSDAGETVFRLDPATGDVASFATGGNLTDPWGLDALPDLTTLVANSEGGILALSADGSQSVFSADPELVSPADVFRTPNGDVFVVDQSDGGVLLRIHDGDVSQVAADLGDVYSLAVAPNGLIYTSDYSAHDVNRVDPATGDVTEVATLADGIEGPIGIEVEPPTCKGKTATIVGSTKNDKLKGSKFKDVIHTLGGKDKVNAKGGNDIVCGGKGKDKLKGGKGKDKLFGQAGKDKLNGGPGKDKERQ